MTAREAVRQVCVDWRETFFHRWNWKTALFSSFLRAAVFLTVTAHAGWSAAWSASLAEFAFRAATAGFYGSLIQAFRDVQPRWQAFAATILALPVLLHTAEFAAHWLRGTPLLAVSVSISAAFTVTSTAFNFFAMNRRAFLVGPGERPFWEDLARMPALTGSFLLSALAPMRSRDRHSQTRCPNCETRLR